MDHLYIFVAETSYSNKGDGVNISVIYLKKFVNPHSSPIKSHRFLSLFENSLHQILLKLNRIWSTEFSNTVRLQ